MDEKAGKASKEIIRINRGHIACYRHIIAVKNDGSIFTTDRYAPVKDWADITAVACGNGYYAGLKGNNTVIVTDKEMQKQVNDWTDIVQLAGGVNHLVGLKRDGSIVAAGDNSMGQCEVSEWQGISDIAAGYGHTVGMTDYGFVYACGLNDNGQCDIADDDNSDFYGRVQIACGYDHTVSLDKNGHVRIYGKYTHFYRNFTYDDTTYLMAIFSGRITTGITQEYRPYTIGTFDEHKDKKVYEDYFSDKEWGIEEYGMDMNMHRCKAFPGFDKDVSDIVSLAGGIGFSAGIKKDGTLKVWFAEPFDYFEDPDFCLRDVENVKELRVILNPEL